jgi:hypothetical protein
MRENGPRISFDTQDAEKSEKTRNRPTGKAEWRYGRAVICFAGDLLLKQREPAGVAFCHGIVTLDPKFLSW